MTRKLAISLPDEIAARLDREPNVSAFVAELIRLRMIAENVWDGLSSAGVPLTEDGRARARRELDALRAGVTPGLRIEAAELAARLDRGEP
jgi:hypothetical protein